MVGPDLRVFDIIVVGWLLISSGIQDMVSMALLGKFSLNLKLDVVWPDFRVLDIIWVRLFLNEGILDLVLGVLGLANVAVLVELNTVNLFD